MTTRKLVIVEGSCKGCPFFDHVYYSYNQQCTKTGEVIKSGFDNNDNFVGYLIPDNCPLPDAPET